VTTSPPKRLRWKPRSLRFQLVALVLALLLVSYAIVGTVTAFALNRFLLDRLDEQVQLATTRSIQALQHPSDNDADDVGRSGITAGQPSGALVAQLTGGRVTAIDVVTDDADGQPTSADATMLGQRAATAGMRTVDLPRLGTYRLQVSAAPGGGLLAVGLPEHPVEATTERLVDIELLVFGAAVLIAGLAGAFGIGWSLRPLRRVVATAHEVAVLPLSSGLVSLPEAVATRSTGSESGQLADAFNRMLGHVESALVDRQRSEDRLRMFVADASHELRTPVAVIRSHAEYAIRSETDLPIDVAQTLLRIVASSERMGRLVEDLLLLARLDSRRPFEHAPLDLSRIVVEAVSDARTDGPDRRWQLDVPSEPVVVDGDEHALQQVVVNLLANARIHTSVGTTVTARLTVCAEGPADEPFVRLSVIDDGPGIPSGIQDRIFDRFVHFGRAQERDSSNTGLGLSIVSAIATAHRGSVRLRTDDGLTAFEIDLPIAAPAMGTDVSLELPEDDSAGLN
jgi:two-component system OmpR family sensor kinase